MLPGIDARGAAIISDCGRYRYLLSRPRAIVEPCVLWIMLNPSTADATHDDATIRKCLGFARRWGFGASIRVVNLYAWRATDPRDLKAAERRGEDVVGHENDSHIKFNVGCGMTSRIVLAWGANGRGPRAAVVRDLVRQHARAPVVMLGDAPRHPLMLAYDTPAIEVAS